MTTITQAITENLIAPVEWLGRARGRNVAYLAETKTLLIEDRGETMVFSPNPAYADAMLAMCGMIGWVFISKSKNPGWLLTAESSIRDFRAKSGISQAEIEIFDAYIAECDAFMKIFEKSAKTPLVVHHF